MSPKPFPAQRVLYAITPDADNTDQLVVSAREALVGGVRVLQYRDKQRTYFERRAVAQRLRSVCHEFDCCFIVNDDIELALDVAADGVHLGREDLAELSQLVAYARGMIIGVSCYDSLSRAQDAVRYGATYVAFGSVFPSSTKPRASPCDLRIIRTARTGLSVPIVAIGGITPTNACQVLDAGAHALAVISGIFAQDNVESATRAYIQLLTNHVSPDV